MLLPKHVCFPIRERCFRRLYKTLVTCQVQLAAQNLQILAHSSFAAIWARPTARYVDEPAVVPEAVKKMGQGRSQFTFLPL